MYLKVKKFDQSGFKFGAPWTEILALERVETGVVVSDDINTSQESQEEHWPVPPTRGVSLHRSVVLCAALVCVSQQGTRLY